MSRATAISWTDHTFNPWWGCTKIAHPDGSGCDHCYAATLSVRFGHRTLWGRDADRRELSDNAWRQPLRWNAEALDRFGRPAFVFCASMGDLFENRRDLDDHRWRLWQLIADTPHLVWLLLTKRPEQMTRLTPLDWAGGWPSNAWAGASVEHDPAARLRVPRLLAVPAPRHFLSVEPMLGAVNVGAACCTAGREPDYGRGLSATYVHAGGCCAEATKAVDWVIVGGESGAGHRRLDVDWVAALVEQCQAAGVPVWTKQDSGPLPGKQGRIPDELWLHERPEPVS